MDSTKRTRGWVARLVSFTKGQRAKLAFSLACAMVGVAAGIVPYLAVYRLIAAALAGTLDVNAVTTWSLAALAGAAVQAAGYLASTATSHNAAYHTLENLRNAACERLAASPLGEVQRTPSGTLKTTIVDDIEQIEIPIAHVIPEFTSNVALLVACVAIAWAIDYRLALSMLVAPALSAIPLALLYRSFGKDYDAYWKANERVNSTLVEYIDGIEVIKAFNQADSSYARYRDDILDFERFTLAWYRSSRIPMNAMYALLPTLLLGVVPTGCLLVAAGAVSPAQMALACMLSIGVTAPLTKVTRYVNMFKEIEKVMSGVCDLLDMQPLPEAPAPAAVSSHGVSFDAVRFSYADDEVLHGVSLEVPDGTTCALVGPSGSGKSTMAKLLVRFWDTGAGSVRIGGVDVRDMPYEQLADLVSFVTQDNFLFDRTIFENVRMGRPDATDAEVRKALEAACCADLERKLPQGFDTPAGDAGHALSGGERQRVSLARAYLKRAPVLVLDEATAFIDPENEELIQQTLSRLARGKTLLVIAHRLSTVRNFAKIAVMDEGRIVATGTHEQLLGSCPLYRRLWEAHVAGGSVTKKEGQPDV